MAWVLFVSFPRLTIILFTLVIVVDDSLRKLLYNSTGRISILSNASTGKRAVQVFIFDIRKLTNPKFVTVTPSLPLETRKDTSSIIVQTIVFASNSVMTHITLFPTRPATQPTTPYIGTTILYASNILLLPLFLSTTPHSLTLSQDHFVLDSLLVLWCTWLAYLRLYSCLSAVLLLLSCLLLFISCQILDPHPPANFVQMT